MAKFDPVLEVQQPFFGAARANPGERLLLLSYHFPPGVEAGALRWQRFARHVAERGWGLDVVTLDPDQLAARDQSRLDELPPQVRVFGASQRTPLRDRLEYLAWRLYRALRPAPKRAAQGPGTPEPAGHASRPASLSAAEARRAPLSLRTAMRAWYAAAAMARESRWAGE